MASFLSSLFGSNEPKGSAGFVYPSESFSILQADIDDKTVIGTINQAYKNYERKGDFPWCLQVSIALSQDTLQDNGLPNEDEKNIANDTEDTLMAGIKKITTAHYVGHTYFDGYLDIFVYLANPKEVHEYLQKLVNANDLSRGFSYEINEDPEWARVRRFMR